MKLRFLLVFLISFGIIFALLNSRFFIANAEWSLGLDQPTASAEPSVSAAPVYYPPLNPEKQGLYTFPPKTGNGGVLIPIQPTIQTSNAGAVLSIARLGLSAPIVFENQQNNKIVYDDLENGVVHYPGTPMPGENGVSIILGHSSAYPWYKGKYGSVFALLGKLNTGDQIQIKYSDGRVLNYKVTASIIFNPLAKDQPLAAVTNSNQPTILLISCWPIGTNYKRIAIQAVQQ